MQLEAERRAEINRANAQKSTGPKTEEGKQRSKYNARRHNLTGQTIISHETDLEAYFASSARLVADLRPEGEYENRVAQSLADAQWQLDRARAIETNLFFELASKRMPEAAEAGDDPAAWPIAQAGAFLENAKQFDLMSRYATRYQRQVIQLHAHLMQLQKERRAYQQKRNDQRHERHQHDPNARPNIHNQRRNEANGFVSQQAHESGFLSQQPSATAMEHGFVSKPGSNPERQRGDLPLPSGFVSQTGSNPERQQGDPTPHHKKTLRQIAEEAIQNKKITAA